MLGNKEIDNSNNNSIFGGRVYMKVIPCASRNKIEKISEGEYKAWVTAAPVDNAANKMLIQVLADYFGVSKSCLTIIGGKTAKNKIIEIQ